MLVFRRPGDFSALHEDENHGVFQSPLQKVEDFA
jgi:hypothetical protein